MCVGGGGGGSYKVNKFWIPYKHFSFVIPSLSEIFIVGPEIISGLLLVPNIILTGKDNVDCVIILLSVQRVQCEAEKKTSANSCNRL